MNIAFLSNSNPEDIHHWSGSTTHIFRALMQWHNVKWLSCDMVNGGYWYHRFFGKDENFYPENYIQDFGRLQSKISNQGDFDAVVLRDYFFGAYLDIQVPIIYLGDTTFRLFKENMRIPSSDFEETADNVEKRMIENADCIIHSSNWAKESAEKDYKCPESKIHVIEFGANIPHPEKYQAEIDTDFG